MKRALIISAIAALAVFGGCKQEPTHKTVTKPKELADPELAVAGIPATLESGKSFDFTVNTKSNAAVSVSNSKPALVIVKKKSAGEYTVSATSSTDADVILTVSQEENEEYASAVKNTTFKVKGVGLGSVPGPNDAVDGTAVTFEEQEGEVVSPERGLYRGLEIYSNTAPLTAADVKSALNTHSLWLLEFYLTDYITGSLPDSFLKRAQTYFDAIRGGGAKALVRFAYRNTQEDPTKVIQEPEE